MQIKFQRASKTLRVLWNETINNTLKFVPAKKTASTGRADARPLAKR